MRTCTKCGEAKDEMLFPNDTSSGRKYHMCKACNASYMKAWAEIKKQDPQWILKERERAAAKAKKAFEAGKRKYYSEAKRLETLDYRRRFPEKNRAHASVAAALKSGRLVRQPCFCGKKAQAHHRDYSKKFEVVWLCPAHHGELHAKERATETLTKTQPV